MEDIKTHIRQLESVLEKNPESPVFARLASLYMTQKQYDRVIQLCEYGTSIYPSYATGFLLKARALQQSDRYPDALEAYNRVLEILPRCTIASTEVDAIQARIQRDDAGVLKREGAASGNAEEQPKTSPEQDISPLPPDRYIENLAERLKGYKPLKFSGTEPLPSDIDRGSVEPDDLPIVSETLAEIFLQQNQYARARDAYRQLQKKMPHKSGIYEEKITEIEERMRLESLR
jgi:tetratricopeptide (TPR) repeat protein